MQKAVIIAAARTPIGSFMGALSQESAPALASVAILGALSRAQVAPQAINEVIMGQVLQAGVGQAPARQAALGAGIPASVPCTTVNKVCGSGLKAVMMATQSIALGESKLVIAGGMESMSNAPYALLKARAGLRMGDQPFVDLMIQDGLFDPYGKAHMGTFGDLCANEHNFSREAQDQYACESYEKALKAQSMGLFDPEIEPVVVMTRSGKITVNSDEDPAKYQPSKMVQLKASFSATGSVTAANASKVSDGAAALVLASEEEARERGLNIQARIIASATYAGEPQWFTTAPAHAIKQVLAKTSLGPSDIDCYEINEAFSVVALHAIREVGIAPERVNIFGGAVALGHPIGCSGARLLVTMLNIMTQKNLKRGLVSLCIGGGEAVAMIIER
jgi:acetyl-CoA C-acetyltransferase